MIEFERLETLANLLDNVPKEKFNLEGWRNKGDCGTVACAVGWATQTPVFRKQGLTSETGNGMPIYIDEHGMEYKNWDAVEKFFGLSFYNATYLFSMHSYSNRANTKPAEVAARIRAMLPEKVAASEPTATLSTATCAG